MTVEESIAFLKKHTINFVWWKGVIRKSLTDANIVGINATASSILRLRITQERIKKIIESENLPLRVEVPNFHINWIRIVDVNI